MMQPKTITGLLEAARSEFGELPALVSNGTVLRYEDLARKADRLGAALNNEPANSGRVVLYLARKAAFAVGLYGTAASGRSAMLCSNESAPSQLRDLVRRYRPDALVVDDASLGEIGREVAGYPGPVFGLDGSGDLSSSVVPRKAAVACGANPNSEAVVFFTSGTTGEKKAVSVSHANLIETSRMINAFMGLSGPAREYVAVSLTHSFGLRRIVCQHLVGGTVVVDDELFNPARTLQVIRDGPCDALSAVPAVLEILRTSFPQVFQEVAATIRFVEIGSAPMSTKTKSELRELFPLASLTMHYGLTEASRVTFLHFTMDAEKLHTVGRPSPGVRVKLTDENGGEVEAGAVGEVRAKGMNVATGYVDDPELSAEKFVDGWLRTGDLARQDEDGYLELLGRTDEMINVGGKKMYPIEIESLLYDAYPEVDCAIGVENHPYLGVRPLLCYGETTPVSRELFVEMLGMLASHVEGYKIPSSAVVVSEVPRTENGKVRRRQLANLFRERRS